MGYEDGVKFLKAVGKVKFRLQQWEHAFFKEKCLQMEELTTFPVELRTAMMKVLGSRLLPLDLLTITREDQADKYLFQLNDGERIETVYMRFQNGIRSLCISTQAGCPCACRFCATGGIGFKRNLTADEIVGQILYVAKTTSGIDRITVMGMGEALLNPHIFEALEMIISPDKFNFSPYRISISTVGIVSGIQRLTHQFPKITLTFSLHFPEQTLREHWMPSAKKFSLTDIFKALDAHVAATKNRTYLAYIVMAGINNRTQDVNHLSQLLHERGSCRYLYHVNLIPFHPISQLNLPETPRQAAIEMQKQLKKHGIAATVRQSFGKSIQAACGQLAAGY